ncbi:hypothetical protein GW17_00043379 [Ensete ventricosum]|nr:hypothetical protein GW17_00043379 [Ensete ventricosum]
MSSSAHRRRPRPQVLFLSREEMEHLPAREERSRWRDRCVVNRGEGLTTVDFSGGDAATAGAIGRSEGQREKRVVVDLLSFDSENELIADGVGKVPLLVGADATVVVHKEDGLVQKNTSVEELRKPTH